MGSLVELSDSSNTCILAVTLPAGWQHTSPVHAVLLPAGTLESIQKERIDASIRRDWHRLSLHYFPLTHESATLTPAAVATKGMVNSGSVCTCNGKKEKSGGLTT
jgi:hypothetical protein